MKYSFSEEDLIAGAKLFQQKEMEHLPLLENYSKIEFSQEFEQKMKLLIRKVNAGDIARANVKLGWNAYIKQGIVAALLCFLLSCLIMPQQVSATCKKIMDAVITVFEDHTEFRLHGHTYDEEPFREITFGYFTEGMNEVERIEELNCVDLLFMDDKNERYFNIYQKQVKNKTSTTYGIDTENAEVKKIIEDEIEYTLIIKKDRIYFTWLEGNYLFSGQTNLSEDEMWRIGPLSRKRTNFLSKIL